MSAVVAIGAVALGLGCFVLVAPALPLWNLMLTLAIGATGISALALRPERPRAASTIATIASALTPIATPAAWYALYRLCVTMRPRRALPFVIAATFANLFLLILFLVRWADDELRGPAILICLFSAAITVGVGVVGMRVGNHRRVEEASARELVSTIQRQREVLEDSLQGERERMALHMHDELGHRLALLSMHSATLQRLDELPPAERSRISSVIAAQVQGAVEALTTALTAPAAVAAVAGETDGETRMALTTLVAAAEEAGLEIRTDVSGRLNDLDADHARLLVRFCREAITNAVKYSDRSTMSFRIEIDGNGLRTEISTKDTSIEREGRSSSAIGLRSLEAQARQLGGRVTYRQDGGETTVSLHLPPR